MSEIMSFLDKELSKRPNLFARGSPASLPDRFQMGNVWVCVARNPLEGSEFLQSPLAVEAADSRGFFPTEGNERLIIK